MVCEAGLRKIGLFVRLKASARNSNHRRSLTLNFLPSDMSKRLIPGPRTMPIPTLPKVPARAGPNTGMDRGTARPGPIWCGSFGVPMTLARKLRAMVPERSPLVLMVSGKPLCAV